MGFDDLQLELAAERPRDRRARRPVQTELGLPSRYIEHICGITGPEVAQPAKIDRSRTYIPKKEAAR
jgi:hypothetical protein